MLKNNKTILALVTLLSLGVASCKKQLDVNTNPNVSQTATAKLLLPAAELYVASGVGVDLQVCGAFWSQHWTQNPNANYYTSIDQYAPSTDFYNTSWTNLYSACENLYQLQNIADSQYLSQYEAIALLLQAYTFEAITDAWGDVPFSQALKGEYVSGHIVSPKYDSQKNVYVGVLKYIDSALKIINPSATVVPGSEDLIYQGNMTKWKKFAYTLKLRTIMRMSLVDPVDAQADIAALYATANVQFLGAGDDAAIKYGYSTSNSNPLYAEQMGIGTQNFAASATIIDSMAANYDSLRMRVFFEPGSIGGYMGITQGAYNVAATGFSVPNVYVGGDVTNTASGSAPVNLMTGYESLFLQAEVAARGWATTTTSDATLFYDAIQANFNYYGNQINATSGVSGATAYSDYITAGGSATNYPIGGSVNQKLRCIMLQKWYAMCGNQSFESWTELRRTGLDSILTPSVTSAIGSTHPKRCLYPTLEMTSNALFPGLQGITNKVWWDLY